MWLTGCVKRNPLEKHHVIKHQGQDQTQLYKDQTAVNSTGKPIYQSVPIENLVCSLQTISVSTRSHLNLLWTHKCSAAHNPLKAHRVKKLLAQHHAMRPSYSIHDTILDHYTHNYCTISANPTCLVIILPGKARERESKREGGRGSCRAGSALAVRRHISLVIPGWCLWTNLKRAIAVSCNTLKALHKVFLHHLSGGPPINQ